MGDLIFAFVVAVFADYFYCKVSRPWLWRRPVKGAFVRPGR